MINQGQRDSLIEANKVVPAQKDTSSYLFLIPEA
jgi:hypothetical protein